jgi:hypothetical protein
MTRGPALLALAMMVFAGCTTPAQVQPAAAPGDTPASGEPAFQLNGHGCNIGGGHSIHSTSVERFVIPEPWKAADILDDIGDQVVYPEEPQDGIPSKGKTWGNWHVTVVCDDWSTEDGALADHTFGFVATRIEAPPFDTGGAERHYILNVLATSDEHVLEHFHEAGFHATGTTGVYEWPAPGVFHHVLDTKDHGVYESIYRTFEMGDAPQGVVRFWWQHENDDGTYSPYAMDLKLTGGKHLRAEPNGYFSHLRTEDHAPIPGAVGNIAGLNWEGSDIEVTLGPKPPVVLEKAYLHL